MHNPLINSVKLAVPDIICAITAISSSKKTFYNNFSYQV
jgi:hypothetical protein